MTEMMESQVVLLPQGMDGCKLQTFAVDLLGRSGNPEAPPGLRSFSGSAALYEGGDVNNLMFLIDLLPKDTHVVVYIHALLCDYIYIYIFIQYIYVHTLLEDIRTEIHFWRENF